MGQSLSLEQIKTMTTSYLLKQQDVACAYLFGSYARGKTRSTSDVDIAILFFPGYEKLVKFDRLLEMGMDLEKLLQSKVDLVDLETTPLTFRHQIMKHKICLIDKDPRLRVRFEVDSRRKYFDLKPALDRRTDALLRKI